MQTLEKLSSNMAPPNQRPPLSVVLVKNLLWIAILIPLSIIGLELIFNAGHLGEECFIQLEPVTGFGHIPNKFITWRSEGYSQTIFDHNGERRARSQQHQVSKDRVVLLGDSVAEGLQVPDSKSFCRLLESRLHQNGMPATIHNFGTSAYGVLQEYLQYLNSARALKPAILIVCYHQGDNNDNVFLEGVNNFYARPYCKLDEKGNLVTDWSFYKEFMDGDSARVFHLFDFLRTNSRIFGTYTKVDLMLSTDQNYQSCKKYVGRMINKLSCWLAKQHIPKPATPTLAACRNITLGAPAASRLLKSEFCKSRQDGSEQAREPNVSEASIGLAAERAPRISLAEKPLCPAAIMYGIAQCITGNDLPKTKSSSDWSQQIKINDEHMTLTAGILTALSNQCRLDGCRLVVVGLPAPDDNQLYVRELNAIRRLSNSSVAQFQFIDLNEKFLQLKPEERTAAFFVYGDHLKAKGHQLVADILFKEIWQNDSATMQNGSSQKQ